VIRLADTHALIWLLTDPGKLSTPAREQLNAAAADAAGGILVSVASRIDMRFVAKKGTFSAQFLDDVWQVVHDPERNDQHR
jgi:PIN domain nuclease of toxin-antitoxin system